MSSPPLQVMKRKRKVEFEIVFPKGQEAGTYNTSLVFQGSHLLVWELLSIII